MQSERKNGAYSEQEEDWTVTNGITIQRGERLFSEGAAAWSPLKVIFV